MAEFNTKYREKLPLIVRGYFTREEAILERWQRARYAPLQQPHSVRLDAYRHSPLLLLLLLLPQLLPFSYYLLLCNGHLATILTWAML